MSTPPPFHKWHFRAEADERSIVFPDGCCDLLIIRQEGQPEQVRIAPFDLRPRSVEIIAGMELTGYRLRPGATLSDETLKSAISNLAKVEDIICSEVRTYEELFDVIQELTHGSASTSSIARGLGMSMRTMQRRFSALHLPSPEYWRLLGRARRACGLLADQARTSDIAASAGFSDQAHMTREFVRWFGITPARLRQDHVALAALSQPALGNWTGEQSSIR